ncbi:MAG: hypothetical protein ACPL4K_06470 [Candidatus Margulisiibacteriota bacterium]
MAEIHGLGAYGIVPYLSEDLLKQIKYANIKTKAGKIAYLLTLGEKAKKPKIEEGIHHARGSLKWIANILEKEEMFHEKQ